MKAINHIQKYMPTLLLFCAAYTVTEAALSLWLWFVHTDSGAPLAFEGIRFWLREAGLLASAYLCFSLGNTAKAYYEGLPALPVYKERFRKAVWAWCALLIAEVIAMGAAQITLFLNGGQSFVALLGLMAGSVGILPLVVGCLLLQDLIAECLFLRDETSLTV